MSSDHDGALVTPKSRPIDTRATRGSDHRWMDTCILQLDGRVFRLVYFSIRASGDLESVEIGRERVEIGDCVRETGAIGRRAWIQGLAIASGLVDAARERLPRAHIAVVVSESVGTASNAEGFFEALRRSTGLTAEVRLPSEILALVTARVPGGDDVSSTISPDWSRGADPTPSRRRSSLPCPSWRP